MNIFAIFCGVIAIFIIFHCNRWMCISQWFRKNNRRHLPPGPWGIPLIGFLIHFIIGGNNYSKKLVQIKTKYGKIASVQMGSYKCIWLNDFALIREAWGNNVFCGRPKIPGTISRTHGFTGGIIFNDGQDFMEQRRFVLKSLKNLGFGRTSMESFILEEVAVLTQNLLQTSGEPISTRHRFNIASINALWRITTGERVEHDDMKLNRLAETLNRNMELNDGAKAAFFMPWLANLFPGFSGWNSYLKDANEIFDFWKEYANSRILKFDQQVEPFNFIDVYIQAMQGCTDESSSLYGEKGKLSLAATLQDLFIAGIETTATTLSWACLFLAAFQDAQAEMLEEIINIIGDTRQPALADRAKMPYTESVIYEILRFGTLAPLGFIHRTMEDAEFHGFHIPKDTIVQANICAVHGDKEYWGDPENFRPRRFLSSLESGDLKLIRHEAFLPFSCGKRLCLGENLAKDELFLFLTSIIQRFSITPDPKFPNPSLDPKIGVSSIPAEHKLVFRGRK